MIANQTYVYFIHIVHLFLNLMPGFIRNAIFRLMLGKAGRKIYFDYDVYIKFPWMVHIGDRVSINRGVEFYSDYFGKNRILIGSDVRIAPNVCFHASGHDISNLDYSHSGGEIVVGNEVWIGAGVIVLPGVTIGDRSVIGAGSVVNRDIPADSVAVGVPAQVIKKREVNTYPD
jgi:maltose O-acetyltransferase